MLLFKVNYDYKLKTSLILKQIKKSNKIAKERVKTLINLYKNLRKSAKTVQSHMKRYYNLKVSKGPDLKRGNKVWLLHKNFLSRQLSKKLDYVKLKPFIVKRKITEVNYKLDLLAKIKIYLVQHIAILKLAYREH